MTRSTKRRLSLTFLLLALLLLPNMVSAKQASQRKAPRPPQTLSEFLKSIGATPGDPTPDVIYCYASGCPSGQRCLNCNGNWVCIYDGGSGTGCSGGPL
jgi:hypothetical protein